MESDAWSHLNDCPLGSGWGGGGGQPAGRLSPPSLSLDSERAAASAVMACAAFSLLSISACLSSSWPSRDRTSSCRREHPDAGQQATDTRLPAAANIQTHVNRQQTRVLLPRTSRHRSTGNRHKSSCPEHPDTGQQASGTRPPAANIRHSTGNRHTSWRREHPTQVKNRHRTSSITGTRISDLRIGLRVSVHRRGNIKSTDRAAGSLSAVPSDPQLLPSRTSNGAARQS